MTFEGLAICTLAFSPLHQQTIQAIAWRVKLSKLNTYTAFYFQIDNKLRASHARRHRKDHKLLIKIHKHLLAINRERRQCDSCLIVGAVQMHLKNFTTQTNLWYWQGSCVIFSKLYKSKNAWMLPNVVITLRYLTVDPGNFDTEFSFAPVLSERSLNSVTVVRVIDQLLKFFKVLDRFSDTHLSEFFHSYNLWFKDFQQNF